MFAAIINWFLSGFIGMLLFCSTCKIIQIPKIITAEEHIPGDISLIIILYYSRFLLAKNRKIFVALRWEM